MAKSLNLQVEFLFRRIAEKIQDEDTRHLISAVVSAYQDRLSELRSLAYQLQEIWNPEGTVGEARPIIELVYQPESGAQATHILDVVSTTPEESAGIDALAIWAAAEAGIELAQVVTVTRTTDVNRTALDKTVQLVAETVGARLYSYLGASEDAQLLNQKRALKSYFSRLKIKGTAQSFELLGKLHGFTDVKFTPLWGRVSPRKPHDLGSPDNDLDFATYPAVVPTPGQPDNFYDPQVLNDGDSFVFDSGLLGIDPAQTDYALIGVNGRNPFIKLLIVGSPVAMPLPGTYFLTGGDMFRKATSQVLPAAEGLSNIQIQAVADGPSFNGLQVTVSVTSGKIRFVVAHNLSSIKFRTSFFNLSAVVNFDQYYSSFQLPVRLSEELEENPNLYAGSPNQAVPFANGGVAVDPFRPWSGGEAPQPTVVLWPSLAVTPGVGSTTSREQVGADLIVVDPTSLIEAGRVLASSIEDVRPATRFPRLVSFGFGLSTNVTYAPYIGEKSFGSVSVGGTITGTLSATDVPGPNYAASFKLKYGSTYFSAVGESNPATPAQISITFAGSGFALTGSYNLTTRAYSFSLTAGAGAVEVFGVWTAKDVEIGHDEPVGARGYQDRPEDEFDSTYVRSFNDDMPWLRPLIAGGELETADFYEKSGDFSRTRLDSVVRVFDENQIEHLIFGVEAGYSIRPFVESKLPETPLGTFQAVGFKLPAVPPPPPMEYPHEGPLSSVVRNTATDPYGVPYNVGLVKGILVGCPENHWTPAHQNGLVSWVHLGEHPNQPYLISDKSNYGLTQEELEAGNFSGSYKLADRMWDSQRGWILNLKAGTGFSLKKERGITGDYAIAFWVKVPLSSGAGGENTIATYGPVKVTMGGSNTWLKVYLKNSAGSYQVVGSAITLSSAFNYIGLSVESIKSEKLMDVDLCVTTNVTRSGTFEMDGVVPYFGQTVLLKGQSTPSQNGHYIVSSGSWIRVTDAFDPTQSGVFYRVLGGNSNSGLYRLVTPGPIVYDTTSLVYARVTSSISLVKGTLAAAATVHASDTCDLQEFSNESPLTVTASDVATSIHDIRVWAAGKTLAEFNLVRAPALYRSGIACRPTFFLSTSGARYSIQVLDSGYAFPNTNPVDFFREEYDRVSRYNFKGEYVGNSDFQVIGFGDVTNIPTAGLFQLGYIGHSVRSHGSTVAGSAHDNLPGENAAWFASKALIAGVPTTVPSGSHIKVTFSGGTPVESIVVSDASSYWPSPVNGRNPGQDRIFCLGSDNQPYKIEVDATASGATLVASRSVVPRTDPLYVRDINGDVVEPRSMLPDTDNLYDKEGDSDAITRIETLAYGRLSVTKTAGNLAVVATTGQTKNLDPAYLYSHFQRWLDFDLTSEVTQAVDTSSSPVHWINPSAYGLANKMGIIEKAGQMIFKGNPSGLVGGKLPAGKYRVVLDVSNYGVPDSEFEGFDLEVSVDSGRATLGRALSNGDGTFDLRKYDGDELVISSAVRCNAHPSTANDAGISLQDAVDKFEDLCGPLLVLTSGMYVSQPGGPYFVKYMTVGAQEKLIVNTTPGWEAEVERVVVGDGSTNEIQRITIKRPKVAFDFTLASLSSLNWKINVYWSNDRTASEIEPGRGRRLCIHGIQVYRLITKLWKVSVVAGPAVEVAEVSVTGGTPATAPGGWQVNVSDSGSRSYEHESAVYEVSDIPNNVVNNPAKPNAGILTGSSANRKNSLINNTPVLVADESLTPDPIEGFVTVSIDGVPITTTTSNTSLVGSAAVSFN